MCYICIFMNMRQKMSVTLELGTKAANWISITGVTVIYRGLFSERIQSKPQETLVNVSDLEYVMKITAIASSDVKFIGNRTKCAEFQEQQYIKGILVTRITMININTLWLSRLCTTKTSCWSNPLGSWHLNEPIPVKLLEKNFPLLETALSHIQTHTRSPSPSIALRWAKNQLSPFLRRKHFPWNGLSVAESRGSADRRQQKMYGPRSGDSPFQRASRRSLSEPTETLEILMFFLSFFISTLGQQHRRSYIQRNMSPIKNNCKLGHVVRNDLCHNPTFICHSWLLHFNQPHVSRFAVNST